MALLNNDASPNVNVLHSLITVTHNSSAALTRFWTHEAPLPAGVEWIVVDNASTDGSAALARSLGATTVIELTSNLGFSQANNVGLEAARGSFIGFINPDVHVNFSDLSELREIAETSNSVVSPQLLNGDGSLQPNGRGFPLLLHKVRNRIGGGLVGTYLLFSTTPKPRNVCWLMGASVMGMRETVDAISGWDPGFFLYYEDKDFCLRAWEAGFSVKLVPSVQWAHGWARETTTANRIAWKYELASMARFYRKYPEFLFGRRTAARRHPQINAEVYGVAPTRPTRAS